MVEPDTIPSDGELTRDKSTPVWLRLIRYALTAGVVGFILYQLSRIGWQQVWEDRPRTIWFYLTWLGLYFQLPAIESLLYGKIFTVSPRRLFLLVLGKRTLNNDVLSYSGEAYFYYRLRDILPGKDRFILGAIKDNAISSSAASTFSVVLIAAIFQAAGLLVLQDIVGTSVFPYVIIGVAVLGVAAVILFRFRRTVFSLPGHIVVKVFATHFGRFIFVVYVLQVLQWWSVLPETPVRVWAIMLVIMSLTNRLPFLPSKDLVGVGIVLGISGLLEASESAIAAMLITRSVLDKGLNLFFFSAISLRIRRSPENTASG